MYGVTGREEGVEYVNTNGFCEPVSKIVSGSGVSDRPLGCVVLGFFKVFCPVLGHLPLKDLWFCYSFLYSFTTHTRFATPFRELRLLNGTRRADRM